MQKTSASSSMSIDERYFDVFIESSANAVYHKLYYHKEANYFYVCR